MDMPTERAAAIIDWMRDQRWFGDKSRVLDSSQFRSFGSVTLGDALVDLLVIDCHFRDGQRSAYFVPLVGGSLSDSNNHGTVVDAFDMAAFREWLASGFGERRVLALNERSMSWIPGPVDVVPSAGRLLRSEQSNTSIQYGDYAVAKVFRRLQPGVNPDVEIVQYLTEQTGFRHVPVHLGTVSVTVGQDEPAVTLAAMQEFVSNQGDGWTWLLREMGGSSRIDEQHALPAIDLLGRRTAEMHRALATPTADPSFAPERIQLGEIDGFLERLQEETDRTMASVLEANARSRTNVEELGANVRRKLDSASSLVDSLKTRVHGDFHLGQVLRTADDFVIIDFEGEPSRPLKERREKASPLKDVAGMLRSLDYSVATLEQSGHGVGSGGASIREWGARAHDAFLNGYRTSLEDDASSLVPHDEQRFFAALDLFLIEKALYEIRYELDNRPHWLEIPLKSLEKLTARRLND